MTLISKNVLRKITERQSIYNLFDLCVLVILVNMYGLMAFGLKSAIVVNEFKCIIYRFAKKSEKMDRRTMRKYIFE